MSENALKNILSSEACNEQSVGDHVPCHTADDAQDKHIVGEASGVDLRQQVAPPTQLVRGKPSWKGDASPAQQESWGTGGSCILCDINVCAQTLRVFNSFTFNPFKYESELTSNEGYPLAPADERLPGGGGSQPTRAPTLQEGHQQEACPAHKEGHGSRDEAGGYHPRVVGRSDGAVLGPHGPWGGVAAEEQTKLGKTWGDEVTAMTSL